MATESKGKKIPFLALGGSIIIAGGLLGASAMLRTPAINLKSDTSNTNTYATINKLFMHL